jgi:hypothetical protein
MDVKRIVEYIQKSPIENKEEVFGEKYKNFKANYPVLFAVACKKEKIDKNMFDMMLNKLEEINSKSITQHEASVEVGQILYNRFVDPVISDDSK